MIHKGLINKIGEKPNRTPNSTQGQPTTIPVSGAKAAKREHRVVIVRLLSFPPMRTPKRSSSVEQRRVGSH